MNVATLPVTKEQAFVALKEYKQHRGSHDARDWEIERIYRAIAKGKKVISVIDAIVGAGVDELKRPLLAICQADAKQVECQRTLNDVSFAASFWRGPRISIPWPGAVYGPRIAALLPRIPPQHRPASLKNYHILWEADWSAIPRDPMLLRRIGKDAFVVLAAWDLTDVEMNVLRAHRPS